MKKLTRSPSSNLSISILALLVAIVSIQTGASGAKQLFPLVGATGATALRLSIAALILGLIWRPWRGKLKRKDAINIGIYGLALGVMNLLFYQAISRIPLGIAVALEFTGPLTLALFASRQALDFLWAILAAAGIYFILPLSDLSDTSAALDPLGILFALGAGCGWAFYILFGRRVGTSVHGGRATALGAFVAMLVALPLGIMSAGSQLIQVKAIPYALIVALLSSVIPYSLEMFALKHMPTKTFSILMSLEPAAGAAVGLIFLNQYLTFLQYFAIVCIILASLGSAVAAKRNSKKASAVLPG